MNNGGPLQHSGSQTRLAGKEVGGAYVNGRKSSSPEEGKCRSQHDDRSDGRETASAPSMYACNVRKVTPDADGVGALLPKSSVAASKANASLPLPQCFSLPESSAPTTLCGTEVTDMSVSSAGTESAINVVSLPLNCSAANRAMNDKHLQQNQSHEGAGELPSQQQGQRTGRLRESGGECAEAASFLAASNDYYTALRSQSSFQSKEHIMRRISETLGRGTLTLINLSQRGLNSNDANLIKMAILQNPQLSVLKLGYNSLGDEGAIVLSSALYRDGKHHPGLTVLDLGFNCVGDAGCTALAMHVVSRNDTLQTLYLSGNTVGERGAMSLSAAVLNGCGLTCLHLTANRIGTMGVKALTKAIAESESKRHVAMENFASAVNESTNGFSGNQTVQELFLGGTAMGSAGCLSVSNMLLTNFSLRVLCLSDNGIDDRDLSLFSQSLSRNKKVPLEVLQLSFNRLTCVGVESLMNAIWGSQTLREVRLDNNQIHDRGAQLAAVVLTSVNLELLDLGFNRITTVGVKALMKSLAENNSLLSLTLSGNPLDTNASKAVSYALAYNRTIQALYADNCSIGYAAQRHIAAGIVSNSNLSLRVVTGFHLGAIAVTLGLPSALENWTNEQVLKFIRIMWERKRHEDENSRQRENIRSKNGSKEDLAEKCKNDEDSSSIVNPVGETREGSKPKGKIGPSDPSTVIAAAKAAFSALGDAGGALLHTEEAQRALSDSSPIVQTDAIMLEKTPSGTVRVPLDDRDASDLQDKRRTTSLGLSSLALSSDSLCTTNGRSSNNPEQPMDPLTRKRNLEWLRLHFRQLNEVAQLPFNIGDRWQLDKYFNSLPTGGSIEKCSPMPNKIQKELNNSMPRASLAAESSELQQSTVDGRNPNKQLNNDDASNSRRETPGQNFAATGLSRKMSFRVLSDAISSPSAEASSSQGATNGTGRRRTVSVLDEGGQALQPATKRPRNNMPRIAYFPRIREKLQQLKAHSDQHQYLVLLRQLKFIEGAMFQGKNVYSDLPRGSDPAEFSAEDAEVILLDML